VNSPAPRYRESPERQLDHVLVTLVQGTDTACQSPAKRGLWRAGGPVCDFIREITEVLLESVEPIGTLWYLRKNRSRRGSG
jgi:hypothetical protein